jgi:membrane-bound inhibitor of C-type lysozyme
LPGDLCGRSFARSGFVITDDHEVVWWNKGKEGFVEMRDDAGEWQSRYNDCKEQ